MTFIPVHRNLLLDKVDGLVVNLSAAYMVYLLCHVRFSVTRNMVAEIAGCRQLKIDSEIRYNFGVDSCG